MEEGREKTCCYWFVGLVVKSGETGLNLTQPIKQFTELVMRSATAIKVGIIIVYFLNHHKKTLKAKILNEEDWGTKKEGEN